MLKCLLLAASLLVSELSRIADALTQIAMKNLAKCDVIRAKCDVIWRSVMLFGKVGPVPKFKASKEAFSKDLKSLLKTSLLLIIFKMTYGSVYVIFRSL